MHLLTDRGCRCYPSDYLFSRIRGRIGPSIDYIIKSNPEVARDYIDREYEWVYSQLNNGLRERLWSFFLYRELKRIFQWLRLGDISSRNTELSLLSEEIKDMFLNIKDTLSRIERLEGMLSILSKRFEGINNAFRIGGLRIFEETLMNSFLSAITVSTNYPVVKEFFKLIIDFRNLISLYKYLRWGIETFPIFLPGGQIRIRDLKKVFLSGDILLIPKISLEKLGIPIDDLTELEIGLYQGLREILRKWYMEDPLKPVVIIYYLWSIHLEGISKPAA